MPCEVEPEAISPRDAPARLRELSPDVRAAVLLDGAGALISSAEDGGDHGEELAGLVRELVSEADGVSGSPFEQLEGQVDGGSVYLTRDGHHVLAAITRRAALASLMLYDQRELLARVERSR